MSATEDVSDQPKVTETNGETKGNRKEGFNKRGGEI